MRNRHLVAPACALLAACILLPLGFVFGTPLVPEEPGGARGPLARVPAGQPVPLPRGFYENRGQIAGGTDNVAAAVRYYAFIGTARLACTASGISIAFLAPAHGDGPVSEATGMPLPGPIATSDLRTYRIDMQFLGANPTPRIEVSKPVDTYLNYYLPHCPDGITHVEGYGELRYHDLYPNIDLVLQPGSDGMKWECIVRPGGRPEDFCIRYEGAERIEERLDGSLRVHWPGGHINEGRPVCYLAEESDDDTFVGSRSCVAGTTLRFDIAPYDSAATLVIDPWATYFGGSRQDVPAAIACDSTNGVVFGGRTYSRDFPVQNAWQDTLPSRIGISAFLTRLDSTGRVRWSTFFGGSRGDDLQGLVMDPSGSVVVIGNAWSTDLPVHNGFQMNSNIVYGSNDDSCDVYLAKFDTAGVRKWATFFGGTRRELARAIGVDGVGNIVACGETRSTNLPVYRAQQSNIASSGLFDIFYLKMTSEGRLIFASYYGGTKDDQPGGIAVHRSGWFALTGSTHSTDFPVLNARQPGLLSWQVAFQLRVDSSGVPLWATYYGGNSSTGGGCAAIDDDGNILFNGSTGSTNLRMKRAEQWTLRGQSDSYLMKCTAQGEIIWATYFGGSSDDMAPDGLAVDRARGVFLGGSTNSSDYPVLNAAYPVRIDSGLYSFDVVLSKFDSAGVLRWSTYFGGQGNESPMDMAVDRSGRVLMLMSTVSRDVPTLNAVQDSLADGLLLGPTYQGDAFIAQFDVNGFIPVSLSSFTAHWGEVGVDLHWVTEREENVYGFVIERRPDHPDAASDWSRVGFVAAHGHSTRPAPYTFADTAPPVSPDPREGDTIRYRLRMVDLDGAEALSPEIRLMRASSGGAITFDPVWPAPSREWLQLSFTLPEPAAVTLTAHAISGAHMATVFSGDLLATGRHTRLVSTAPWPSGLYLYTLSTPSMRIVRKGLILH